MPAFSNDLRTDPQVAGAIKAAGGLEPAIALAFHDGAAALLQALLAHRARQEERADPALMASRLRASADSLDGRAERLFAEAAEFFGKAAHRAGRDELALARDFRRRAESAELCAEALSANAADQREQAAMIEGALARASGLASIAAA